MCALASAGRNHEHMDSNDVVSLIIMVGGDDVVGGDTKYFDGGNDFDRRRPAQTRGNCVLTVLFKHGRYQVTSFDRIVHAGTPWTGERGIVSFYLNEQVLQHFEKYGSKYYMEKKKKKSGPKPTIMKQKKSGPIVTKTVTKNS